MIKNILISLVIAFNLTITVHAEQILDRIVATVGDDIITFSELSSNVKLVKTSLVKQQIPLPESQVLQQQVLNKLILDRIQLQLANKFAIEVDSSSLNQAILQLAKNENLSLEQYKQKMINSGMAFDKFREQVKTELILSRLQQREIGNDIRISAVDIDGYLNSPLGQDTSGTEYKLSHILILAPDKPNPANVKATKAKINMIMEELKQGKDFQQLAASYSSGSQALEGGDLGWRQINEVPTLFVKYVPSMKIGEVLGPIESTGGFHIIKLQNKRTGKQNDYQELHVRQILIKPGVNTAEQEAVSNLLAFRKQIIQGADFAKLAEKKSEELSSATKGGDLGWINDKSVLPEFWEEVYKLNIGEIGEPFKTSLGWHLVQVIGRRDVSSSKEALRHRIAEILREQKFNEMLEIWLKKIRDEAKVEILL